MQWILALAIGLLVSCKLNPQALTEQGETKNFTSSQDESGTQLQVTLHDATEFSNCLVGDRSYTSLYRGGSKVFSNDLKKCVITATRITKDGDWYIKHMNMSIVEEGVRYFCDGAELCSAARDAIGNFLEILFYTSKKWEDEDHAENKKFLEGKYEVPLLNSATMPGDHPLIRDYPPLPDDKGIPMRAYLVRIYAYLDAFVRFSVKDPTINLHYRCDKCWKNVTFTGSNAGHLKRTIKPVSACVQFNDDGAGTVQALVSSVVSPASLIVSQGTGSDRIAKIDEKLLLSCPSGSIPHIVLTCVGKSGNLTANRIAQRCRSLNGAIGTMPITRDHYGKTICAKLPPSYNLNMFSPNKVRKFSRAKAKNGDYSFDDEIVTFRVTDSTCDQHTELSIDINKSL